MSTSRVTWYVGRGGFPLRMTFTRGQNNSTNRNEKLLIVHFSPTIVTLFFTLEQLGQLSTFFLVTFEFLLKRVKMIQPFQCFLYLKIIRNNKTIFWLEYDKIRILVLISFFNETFTYVSSYLELFPLVYSIDFQKSSRF